MIEEISIQNFALIDRLSVRFSSGMTVLSGETGAGKSILAGALGLLHGERADTGSIRTGCQEAMVTGIFRVAEESPVTEWLQQRDIQLDEGRLYLRRTIKRAGRGSIYIQSVPVPLKELSELGSMLFDMHGQHEHQSLFMEENHRRILDSFGRLDDLVDSYHTSFQELSRLRRRMNAMVSDEQDRLREMDILTFAVQEIEAARLSPSEEDDLIAERTTLTQYEKLHASLESSYQGISESRGGAMVQLRTARAALDAAAEIDPQLADLSKRLEEMFFELEDIS
ncbi:MAG: AAA family ATPase, partial [Spirochaeta sp.]